MVLKTEYTLAEIENIMGKGESAGYYNFSLCFLKGFLPRVVKTRDHAVKGLINKVALNSLSQNTFLDLSKFKEIADNKSMVAHIKQDVFVKRLCPPPPPPHFF